MAIIQCKKTTQYIMNETYNVSKTKHNTLTLSHRRKTQKMKDFTVTDIEHNGITDSK